MTLENGPSGRPGDDVVARDDPGRLPGANSDEMRSVH